MVLCLFHVLFVHCYVFFLVLMEKSELVALLCLSSWFLVALPHGAVGWSAECDCGIF